MTNANNVLFIVLPSSFTAYAGSKLNAGTQIYPLLSYAYLGATLRQKGAEVKILDLGIEENPYYVLEKTLKYSDYSIIGITATTPLFYEASKISKIIREMLGSEVKIILGGAHGTALPVECLENSEFDIVVCGEGDYTIIEIYEGKKLSEIDGICYKQNGKIYSTRYRKLINNLDLLLMPAMDLYNPINYKCSKSLSRKSPICNMETSRGCPSKCTFCNKNISGTKYRVKSPLKVIEEIKYVLGLGFKEIRFIDDQFNANPNHAKNVCESIIRNNLHFPWSLAAGIRVDNADLELLKLAKRAGCYQVGIGFESGDQKSLDSIDKDITIEESVKCMEIVKKSGLESIGFFIFGLPADDEESLKKTMKFAIKLFPDLAKVTIMIPFPGTRLFEQYEKQGLIKSKDWTLYNLHRAGDIYNHPKLSHVVLEKYYNLFFKKFYLNPKYILRQLIKGIFNFTLHRDIYYALQTFFPKVFS